MTQYIQQANLHIADNLYQFIEQEVLPNIAINSTEFWQNFSQLVHELTPINKQLLAQRDKLQSEIDSWYDAISQDKSNKASQKEYISYLKSINYITPEIEDFAISTENVDAEISLMAGPQLVVPVMNARFALNAVNARWGSLYDALYGSDVITEENGAEKTGSYNPIRGQKVVHFAKNFLNESLPLMNSSYHDVTAIKVTNNSVEFICSNGKATTLQTPEAFKGYSGSKNKPNSILLQHNGLYIELLFDESSPVGKQDPCSLSDVYLESALTTIMDCEDSVAAVDAEDKIIAYRNWLQLNQGTLTESITKNGHTFTRKMNSDKSFTDLNGQPFSIKGRSLMFIRNVGHLMRNNAILDSDKQPIYEGIMDAMITSTISLHDIKQPHKLNNSKQSSIYIVKPKMHGPDEVKFADTLFARVEQCLNLPKNTIKMGIMDEERRTSVNLKSCIYQAKERVVFINTGFLDRTGDEIHTCMHAGPVERKCDIKNTAWIKAYELNNVAVGLRCGLSGKAQIGKGMWAIPDQMANMLNSKQAHPLSGANTAWVPSPTAATLHALHYHEVDVFAQQQTISTDASQYLPDMLTPPLAENTNWTNDEITAELDNNAQGILGYVVRWIDQGVGCSKVPDINNVGLMEDRATLRISSQHIANWLKHNICTKQQVIASLKKMAAIVDAQNSSDPNYQPMCKNIETNIAFKAASALIFEGEKQPNGYTEPLLHQFRAIKKQK
jgi:malate synthase